MTIKKGTKLNLNNDQYSAYSETVQVKKKIHHDFSLEHAGCELGILKEFVPFTVKISTTF